MADVSTLDRLIGWLSPARGLRRYWDRQRLARAYEAASPRDPWKPRRPGASANADHAADAPALRSKARALRQNVPYIRAGLDSRAAAIVGTGIVPTFKGRDGKKLQALWREFVKTADADRRRDMYGLQADAVRALDVDGEVLLRIRVRRPDDPLPVPLQLQLLEVDWLDTVRQRGEGANQVVNGIEYDAIGAPVAYWLWDQHPGDSTLKRGTRTESRRVPAESIIHLFSPERPGQGRGFSRLAPVIARVRDLQLYEDAEQARKNLESRLGVLVSGDASQMVNPIGGGAADPAQAAATGSLGELASGSITQLPPGVNVTVVEPTSAPGYVDYVKHQLHLICAGGGWTYEAATGDMREVNFSSARIRQIDFRREIEQLQWLVIVPMLCQRIVDAFVRAAQLAGKLSDRPSFTVEHSTPKWDYVNPKQEIDADLTEISGGLSSISEKLRRRGYDPIAVFDEMQGDVDELKKRGLLEVLLALQGRKLNEAPAAGAATSNGE